MVSDLRLRHWLYAVSQRSASNTILRRFCLGHCRCHGCGIFRKFIHAVYLFLQYSDANDRKFTEAEQLYLSFTHRLYTGTIADNGLDKSGLFWLPLSKNSANIYIAKLNRFSDFLVQKFGTKPLNPFIQANSYERKMQYVAYVKRTSNKFLGHIRSPYINEVVGKVRIVKRISSRMKYKVAPIAFPESLFPDFFLNGVGGGTNKPLILRNKLILLLLHFGGLRIHEALHLWIDDVTLSKFGDESSVVVKIFHPQEGLAPNRWASIAGKTTREAYLQEVHGLKPRNVIIGPQRLGWKGVTLSGIEKSLPVYFFPIQVNELFNSIWREYCSYLIQIKLEHPYAFISFDSSNFGKPLTLNAFYSTYKTGLRRIGRTMNKSEGLAPHSHRHATGRRLTDAGVNEKIIQNVLHHSNLSSQEVYTNPSTKAINNALNLSMKILDNNYSGLSEFVEPSWDQIMKGHSSNNF